MEKIFNLETLGIIAAIIAIGMIAFSVYKHLRKVIRKKSPEAVQDFTGKFERRHYKFHNGLECYQEQLNLTQNELFSVLLDELDLGDMAGFTLEKMNRALYLKQGMRKLFAIALLRPDGSKLGTHETVLFGQLKEEEVEAIVQDFFTLNPAKKAQFDFLKAAAVSQMILEAKGSGGASMTAQPAQ